MKEHGSPDSPDTESLLSVEQSQEKLLPSLPSTPTTSRRNKRLKTYLHVAAIVFYSVLTAILYTWSTRINGKTCDNAVIYCKKTDP
jgi:hypothetical protein